MTVILIDGPEKAGKSTVIAAIERRFAGVEVRRWGPVSPDDRVYSAPMAEDLEKPGIVVWDRGWPSEYVYGTLLNRDRRLTNDPWLGEWLHGRALQTAGVRCILLGPDPETLTKHRNETDLPVPPAVERQMYQEYGFRFGYVTIDNQHTPWEATKCANMLVGMAYAADTRARNEGVKPPWYAGPADAKVVFVGEHMGNKRTVRGAWLPLSSRLTTMLGRDLEDDAFKCGWTNAADCPPQALRNRELIVACGDTAAKWVEFHVQPRRWIRIDHPAYIYRWKDGSRGQEIMGKRLTAHRKTLDNIRQEA